MAQSRECTVGAAAQSGQLDDMFLMKLSEQLGETLGSQHMQLGVYLRLDPSTVQKLRADSKAPLETTFLLLKTWRDSRGKREDSGAMFDVLCRALSDLKRPDLTDDVRRAQMKLLKEELRGAKAEVESCRQKYDVVLPVALGVTVARLESEVLVFLDVFSSDVHDARQVKMSATSQNLPLLQQPHPQQPDGQHPSQVTGSVCHNTFIHPIP
ncbi:hypothetical protein LSAT2_014249 [Lamellibrachia satsuma]|nr:hypothetical protein LSAT2_014249 [Lamellibrachia satsuma]